MSHALDDLAQTVAALLLESDAGERVADEPPVRVDPPAASSDDPFETEDAPIDAVTTVRHVRLLTTVLQALTLRGRGLAESNVQALGAAGPLREMTDPDADVLQLLMDVHRMLLEHPVASRALFGALAEEGRRYATTSEGAALREALIRSRSFRRGALLWNTLTMGLLDEDDPTILPSTVIDVMTDVVQRGDLEALLGRLRGGEDR